MSEGWFEVGKKGVARSCEKPALSHKQRRKMILAQERKICAEVSEEYEARRREREAKGPFMCECKCECGRKAAEKWDQPSCWRMMSKPSYPCCYSCGADQYWGPPRPCNNCGKCLSAEEQDEDCKCMQKK